MRTNLAFMLGKDKKVIMFTSANPGSGKTFISANLSVSLAIQGKKVVAVDLDMRKSSLSKYINRPKPGVANYLSGQYDNIEDIVYKDSLCKGLDVIPVGTTPPNPAELLDSDRLAALFNELREKYDYIVVDCPPIEIVTDPTIITKHVDMTLFVIRANLMQRELVPEIDKLYTNKQLTNMAVVLNGTSDTFNYGYSKYGYHYGYRYGYRRYGYGSYGYGYGNDDSKS
jgi:capsular exopolysaccharide synthesis family protein